MVFSAEGETSPDGPVDLFFLFDASASQDNQIEEMIRQSENIIKKFAGTSSEKDKCRVGSALFLGPNMRLMCGQHLQGQDITRPAIYSISTPVISKKGGNSYRYTNDV